MPKRPGRLRKFVVRREDQLAAVRSPVRQEIVHHMASGGACSVAELAKKMDRSPDSLYYHIKAMLKVGLLIERPPRRTARRTEAIYSLPGDRIKFDYDPASESSRRALIGAVSASLRMTDRDFRAALRDRSVVTAGPHQSIRSRRLRVRLTRDGLAKLNSLLNQLDKLVWEENQNDEGSPFMLTYVVTPVKAGR